jgi:glycosyltransferase involved in cell wall biosynthesis
MSPTPDYRSAGIHQYIVGLTDALADSDECDLRIFASVNGAGTAVRSIPAFTGRPAGRIAWEQLVLPWSLLHDDADLIHSPAYSTPILSPVPAVVTVHDMSFFRMPETLPDSKGRYLRAATRVAIRLAAAVIAVSEFTKSELVEVLGIDPGRVFVVPNGVSQEFRPAGSDDVDAFVGSADLPRPYILSVGTIEPRKNLGTLLTAYSELIGRVPDAPALVVAGAPGWGRSDLGAPIEALGLQDRVHVVGHVPSEQLPLLYSGADLFVFPSRYEGFGLPVVEAMACGTPVVASRASSISEVAGDAAALVEPDDVPGWVVEMQSLLASRERALDATVRGAIRASEFTWHRAAQRTLEVYRHVIRTRQGSAADLGGARRG